MDCFNQLSTSLFINVKSENIKCMVYAAHNSSSPIPSSVIHWAEELLRHHPDYLRDDILLHVVLESCCKMGNPRGSIRSIVHHWYRKFVEEQLEFAEHDLAFAVEYVNHLRTRRLGSESSSSPTTSNEFDLVTEDQIFKNLETPIFIGAGPTTYFQLAKAYSRSGEIELAIRCLDEWKTLRGRLAIIKKSREQILRDLPSSFLKSTCSNTNGKTNIISSSSSTSSSPSSPHPPLLPPPIALLRAMAYTLAFKAAFQRSLSFFEKYVFSPDVVFHLWSKQSARNIEALEERISQSEEEIRRIQYKISYAKKQKQRKSIVDKKGRRVMIFPGSMQRIQRLEKNKMVLIEGIHKLRREIQDERDTQNFKMVDRLVGVRGLFAKTVYDGFVQGWADRVELHFGGGVSGSRGQAGVATVSSTSSALYCNPGTASVDQQELLLGSRSECLMRMEAHLEQLMKMERERVSEYFKEQSSREAEIN